jgi:hypothetical protein
MNKRSIIFFKPVYSGAFLLLFVILFFSACKDDKVENVNLNNVIDSYVIAVNKDIQTDSLRFELCSYIPFKWDSLVVAGGYSTPETLAGFKFDNQHVLEQFIDFVDESSYILLYIYNNRIVGYSDLYLPMLDFDMISRRRHLGYTVMYESECNFLLTRKQVSNGRMYFSLQSTLTE